MKTSIPLYHHLKANILGEIQSGVWESGSAIPSEPELARQYGVSRTTVRQAIGDLVSAGYLTRRQGKGTFVAIRKNTRAESPLYGFVEELRQRGREVEVHIIRFEFAACPDEIKIQLGIMPSAPLLHIVRIAKTNGKPVFYESSWLVIPPHLGVDELNLRPEQFDSIYGYFEKHGVKIGLGKQTIRAGLASRKDAEFLQLASDSPVLIISRLTQDVTASPVEFSEVVYAGDLYEFVINLHREES